MTKLHKLFAFAQSVFLLGTLVCCESDPDDPHVTQGQENVELSSAERNVVVSEDGTSATVAYGPVGGTVKVAVKTTLEWEHVSSGLDGWCSVTKSGLGLRLETDRFGTDEIRRGTIEITADGKTYALLEVVQQGMGTEPDIVVERESMIFPDNGGEQTVLVMTNQPEWDFEVESGSDWLSVRKNDDDTGLLLSAEANREFSREATVAVQAVSDGVVTATCRIAASIWESSFVLEVAASAGTTVALPLRGTVNLQVCWGDEEDDYTSYAREINSVNDYLLHTYEEEGTYRIRCRGDASVMSYRDAAGQLVPPDYRKPVTAVVQWGALGLTDMTCGLTGTSVESVAPDEGKALAGVRNARQLFQSTPIKDIPADLFSTMTLVESFSGVFYGCSSISEIPESLFARNTAVSDFSGAFYNTSISEVPENLFAECGEATDFSNVFTGCTELKSIPAGLFSGNRKAVKFSSAFEASGLEAVPESLFGACTEATTFENAFAGTAIRSIPAGLFANNRKAEIFRGCFSRITALTEVPSGLFDNCPEAADFYGLFSGAENVNNFPQGLLSNNPKVRNVSQMFRGCSKMREIPSGIFAGCPEITAGSGIFMQCAALREIPDGLFDTFTAVTDMSNMFTECLSLEAIPRGIFTSCTQATDFRYAFLGCTSLKEVTSGIFPPSAKVLTNAFSKCTGLTAIHGDAFQELVNVTNLNYIFQNCSRLTAVPEGLFSSCGSCETYGYAFSGCSALDTLPARLFNAASVTNFYQSADGMFKGCTSLKSIPDDLFSTFSSATTMQAVFDGCTSLETVPPSLFAHCESAANFSFLFRGCTSLRSVPTGIFDDCRKVKNFSGVFNGCGAVSGESPYTVVEGVKVHLWERSASNGFVVPTSRSGAFTGASFSDMDTVPDDWM